MNHFRPFVLLACALLAACAQTEVTQDPLAIANAFVAREFPEVNVARMRTEVAENETSWTVTYRPPPGSVGGGPVVVIEKPSGRVVSAQSFQ